MNGALHQQRLLPVDLRLGDSSDPALAGLGADLAVLNMVLHHTPDPARTLSETAASLASDGQAWTRMFGPFVDGWDVFIGHLLRSPFSVPTAPRLMARSEKTGLRN